MLSFLGNLRFYLKLSICSKTKLLIDNLMVSFEKPAINPEIDEQRNYNFTNAVYTVQCKLSTYQNSI